MVCTFSIDFQRESILWRQALWLHGLSLTIPFNMTMSFPYGTNTKNIKEADICPIILRSHYSEGIIEIERLPGQFIKFMKLNVFWLNV